MNFKKTALYLGPLLFVVFKLIPHSEIDELSWNVLAVAVWMLVWWLSETVNLAVTALLPMVLFPVLEVMPLKEVSTNYANPLVYLFFGGFILALSIEKWGLHKRIALQIIKFTGFGITRITLGFMLATAFLSMWISNTATTVMMLPIAISVIKLVEQKKKSKFAVLLLIGVAWAANIGGMATLVGTPPNLVMAGFMKEELGREIFFSEWIVIGLPITIVLLIFGYFLLTFFIPNDEKHAETESASILIHKELSSLGKIKGPELRVAIVFFATAIAWITRKQIVELTGLSQISDTTIALLASVILFITPTGQKNNTRLLKWKDTEKLGWGILLLFGGGLALASGIQQSIWVIKIGDWIGTLGFSHLFLMIAIMTVIGVFLTEIVSNLALVTALMPLVAAIALGANIDFFNLGLPLTLGASCAFMFPMATPPNAIVFSSGRITVIQMARYGFLMNWISVAIIALACWLFL